MLRPDAAPDRLADVADVADVADRHATGRALRLGTRASELATSQSGWVADHLRAAGYEVELVPVRTVGDVSRASLSEIGGTGVFASALREALHEGTIDLAVHSLKDLPTTPEPGLVVAAVPEREDPRDALVARDGLTLATLPEGARVGTGSPRRAAQLAQLRPDLDVRDIRGNVGTRIAMVRDGELDAVVLACAGLSRLGRLDEATERLDLSTMLPAPGQGALAVECRDGHAALADLPPGVVVTDADLRGLLADALEHPPTRAAVTAERAVLARLEAGCTAPVGAHAAPAGLRPAPAEEAGRTTPPLTLSVFVALRHPQRHEQTGSDPVLLGRTVAEHLLNRPDPTRSADRPDGGPGVSHTGA
ncbi:hydroxymethylbilane synthase [Ornithinimicrobium avium]|uniref:Porphobilinogen deaminase n=2 Tax=Ornithinimicrobium avium TaxID=2283195 RepID=A0A345NSY7_9MICO|nr:hydroxymethylbilane synthase [Ornithinimicrobium avium]